MVDILLVVVEKIVLFLGESIGLEIRCEQMVGSWIDVREHVRLFAFVHYGGEVEGVGVVLLATGSSVSGLTRSSSNSDAVHPFAFGCLTFACLIYLSPSTNRFHR